MQNKIETKVETRERKRERVAMQVRDPNLHQATMFNIPNPLYLPFLPNPLWPHHLWPSSIVFLSSSSSSSFNLISNGVHHRDSYFALNRVLAESSACDQTGSCRATPFWLKMNFSSQCTSISCSSLLATCPLRASFLGLVMGWQWAIMEIQSNWRKFGGY